MQTSSTARWAATRSLCLVLTLAGMTTLALAPKNPPRMEIEIPEGGIERPVTNPQKGPKLPVMMWVLPDANGLTFQSQVTFKI